MVDEFGGFVAVPTVYLGSWYLLGPPFSDLPRQPLYHPDRFVSWSHYPDPEASDGR
jgi:hypothetical protein